MHKRLFLFVLLLIQIARKLAQDEEICANFQNRRMYVEMGKKGSIVAKQNNTDRDEKQIQLVEDTYKQCRLELVTCPHCILSMKFIFLNITQHCNKSDVSDTCYCDYVLIYEPPFDSRSGKRICGQISDNSLKLYKSKTRTVVITLFYKKSFQHAFTLQYETERNREVITIHENNSEIISTPFFPNRYSRDFNIEYLLKCEGEGCKISLTFSDFLIGKMSVIEFFDSNGERLNIVTGRTFRPSPIISIGRILIIRFYANGASNKGFKARSTYLSSEMIEEIRKPQIDCGGVVDNLGGGITMMDMTTKSTYFDCIWIIKPGKFLHFHTHLYLKVVEFSDFGKNTELIIYQDITSSGIVSEVLNSSNVEFIQQQHVRPISEGFYIRFKGIVNPESKLAIIYTAFSYKDCIPGSDFVCKNLHCIPIYLQCDGFDHCGDNSDEPRSCLHGSKQPRYSSNFFFPKTEHYWDLHTAAVVFLICSFAFVSLIFGLIIFILRINGRVRQERNMESHFQIISELLDDESSCVEIEVLEDEPPVYESPPNYEEVHDFDGKQLCTMRRKPFRRGSCHYCRKKIIAKFARHNTVGKSTQIPDSPPPAYSGSNSGSTETAPGLSNSVVAELKNNTNTSQMPCLRKAVSLSNLNKISVDGEETTVGLNKEDMKRRFSLGDFNL